MKGDIDDSTCDDILVVRASFFTNHVFLWNDKRWRYIMLSTILTALLLQWTPPILEPIKPIMERISIDITIKKEEQYGGLRLKWKF